MKAVKGWAIASKKGRIGSVYMQRTITQEHVYAMYKPEEFQVIPVLISPIKTGRKSK